MRDQEDELSDSDEEVPRLQLCCLSLTELRSLDLSTTKDVSVLLAVMATGENETVLAILSGLLAKKTNLSNIQAGGVEVILKAMKNQDERIRLEAFRVLSNLLYDIFEQTSKVLKSHCIAALVDLLNFDESWDNKEQVIWALSNIAADSPIWRNKVLEAGGLTAILSHIKADCLGYMKHVCRAVSNMIRMKPPPPITYLTQAGPFILSQLRSLDDIKTRSDLLWALCSITKATVEGIGLNQDICIDLIRWMDTTTFDLSLPAVHALQNITFFTDAYTDILIESGLFGKVQTLLMHPNTDLRKGIFLLLSNLCVESTHITDKVIQAGITSQVISLFFTGTEEVNGEMVLVLSNACTYSSPTFLPSLLQIGICSPLIEALSLPSRNAVVVSLKGLTALIQYGKEHLDSEKLSSYMDVGELVEKCTALARNGVAAAENLLRSAVWLIPDAKEVQVKPDTHKQPRH